MNKRVGQKTVVFQNPPEIVGGYNVVGPKEGQGPLNAHFDYVLPDTYNGEKTWEKTESSMIETAMNEAIKKHNIAVGDIDYVLAGDLLNQITTSSYAVRQIGRPFIGMFGACSTMALATAVGAMLIDGGFAGKVLCATSSHHDTAERQFRMPTEHGNQRPLTAQWTVTGAGCLILSAGQSAQPDQAVPTGQPAKICVTAATLGGILDYGQKDANQMGAAMAPAVADTLLTHFYDLGTSPEAYDLIVSGDLGTQGLQLLKELLGKSGFHTLDNLQDCGCMIYHANQDTHAGGSGCGCSAVVLSGYLLDHLRKRDLRKILFIGSGSLHSKESLLQGESIPGIGHAVVIEALDK
ncbi:MAG: stage V sporulation protein AD [Peptococcaceae bacterium]|jgi:stage V sporulation protein AD|nr:stage V sporulation protein AD [Peptococcaceae bacterium]MDR2736043.1 stage V sporulation protein AD [Gracilibacteraceae bacterium]